ncbi:MAG: hypothetical protein IJR85_05495 [Synergistaceae bacterium]|nr:hypothetical protein [Synergistaceae bacterium]
MYQSVYLDDKYNDVTEYGNYTTECEYPTGFAVICAYCWGRKSREQRSRLVWDMTPGMAIAEWNRRAGE